jgi:hypothetical protein
VTDFVADGQPFETPDETAYESYSNLPVSLGQGFSASLFPQTHLLERSAQTSPQIVPGLQGQIAKAFDQSPSLGGALPEAGFEQGPKLQPDDASKYLPEGSKPFAEPVNENVAKFIGDRKRADMERDNVLSRFAEQRSLPVRLGTSLVAGALDPTNIATSFLPGVGEESILSGLGRIGVEGAPARLAARAGSGATTFAAAASVPTAIQLATDPDYTLRSAFSDLMYNAAIGAVMHVVPGLGREFGLLRPDSLMQPREAAVAAPETASAAPAAPMPSTAAPEPADPTMMAEAHSVLNAAPHTRADAMKAAVSQMVDGRPVDVSDIFQPARQVETAPAPTVEFPVSRAPLMLSEDNPSFPPADTSVSHLESLDPATIGVDAARFQFKSGGDAEGVTDRLQGVQKWDPRLAGTALVWKDENGALWVADGHQRLGLAKRLSDAGQSGVRLNAFVLDSAQGVTDAQARVIAAAKNIAEGSGSPIDAAKIMREATDAGIEIPAMPPRSALVKDGQALARLSPDAFGMAVNDVVPVNQAAIVGRLVSDRATQVEAMRVLAKAKPDNARQAEMIVRDMLDTGVTDGKQTSLFGEEHFAESVVLERARIADEALKQLQRDKSTFRTLVSEADRIEGHGGNSLDSNANLSRLSADERAAQFLTQLATRKGPVSDALTGIARRYKSGAISASAAAREFVGVVRGRVESGLGEGPASSGAFPRSTSPEDIAVRQNELYRNGYIPGFSQDEVEALNRAVYKPEIEEPGLFGDEGAAAPEPGEAADSATVEKFEKVGEGETGEMNAATPEQLTGIDADIADMEARLAKGAPIDPAAQAEIAEADAAIEQSARYADAYSQAAECLGEALL